MSCEPNTLRPRQNGRHFPDDIFKWIFVNENAWISINISLKFVPRGPIHNIPTLVQIMAWRRPGDKPLSEPMLVSSLTHICVTRPQWVKYSLESSDLVLFQSRSDIIDPLVRSFENSDPSWWKLLTGVTYDPTFNLVRIFRSAIHHFSRLSGRDGRPTFNILYALPGVTNWHLWRGFGSDYLNMVVGCFKRNDLVFRLVVLVSITVRTVIFVPIKAFSGIDM